LDYAKRDSFWEFINQTRSIFRIEVSDYSVFSKDPEEIDKFAKKYTSINEEDMLMQEKLISQITSKAKPVWNKMRSNSKLSKDDMKIFEECDFLIEVLNDYSCKSLQDRLEKNINWYINSKMANKRYADIEKVFYYFLIFDISSLPYTLISPGKSFEYIPVDYKLCISERSEQGPFIRIFSNTTPKRIRKGFESDFESIASLERAKANASPPSPIMKKQPRYFDKLLVEFERRNGDKKYSEILTKKTESLSIEDLLDITEESEKKTLNRLRQYKSRGN